MGNMENLIVASLDLGVVSNIQNQPQHKFGITKVCLSHQQHFAAQRHFALHLNSNNKKSNKIANINSNNNSNLI